MNVEYVCDMLGVQEALTLLGFEKSLSFDIETTGLDPLSDRPLLLQFCAGREDAETVYVVNAFDVDPRPLVQLLANRLVLCHNAAFEWQFVKRHYGIEMNRTYDSLLAEGLLTAGAVGVDRSLDALAARYLGIAVDKTLQKSFVGAAWNWEPTPEQIEYAALDAWLLPRIRPLQVAKLRAEKLFPTMDLERDALPVFAGMGLAGLRLNTAKHDDVLARYRTQMEQAGAQAVTALDPWWQEHVRGENIERALYHSIALDKLDNLLDGKKVVSRDADDDFKALVAAIRKERDSFKPLPATTINLRSRSQVLEALRHSGVPLPDLQKRTVKQAQTEYPQYHALGAYIEWKKAEKIVSTYGDTLAAKVNPLDGRVHSSYRQIVSTGRCSSRNPNFQNMPPDIRSCFEADEGNTLVIADFANMELRILAGLSGDPTMLRAFERGQDLHKMTAAAAWPEKYPNWEDVPHDSADRKLAKIGNFATIYGASPFGLFSRGIMPDEPTAQAIVDGFKRVYPVATLYLYKQGNAALDNGYSTTALGRKRYFTVPGAPPQPSSEREARAYNRVVAAIQRRGANHVIQGTGADITKRAMVLIAAELGDMGRVVNAVHDEIVVECGADCADRVSLLMGLAMERAGREHVPGCPIPADVKISRTWEKE